MTAKWFINAQIIHFCQVRLKHDVAHTLKDRLARLKETKKKKKYFITFYHHTYFVSWGQRFFFSSGLAAICVLGSQLNYHTVRSQHFFKIILFLSIFLFLIGQVPAIYLFDYFFHLVGKKTFPVITKANREQILNMQIAADLLMKIKQDAEKNVSTL